MVNEYRRRLVAVEAQYTRAVGPARRRALDRIRDELGRFLAEVDRVGIPDRVTRAWVTNLPAYRQLVAVAEAELDRVTGEAVRAIQWRIAEAAQLGQVGATALTAATIGAQNPVSAALGQVNVGAMQQLVGALQSSSPLANLPALTQTAIEKMGQELVRGLANGTHSRVIGRRIAQAANIPAARAATIARTEIHRAYRETNRASFQASPAVNAWRWVAQLGPGSCAACWAMHGSVHGLDEQMGSHPNCRCAMVPVVDQGVLASIGITDVPDIQWPTGEQEFAKLDPDVQLRILGPSKFERYPHDLQLADVVHTRQTQEWGTTRSVASLDESLRNAA